MLADDAGVALAAHAVGYESSSQFSREYSRLFGAPPLRDKQRWRDEATQAPDDRLVRPEAPSRRLGSGSRDSPNS